MDGPRKQRRDNYGRSQNKKPPRGSWQPKVPSWEKQFCKIVGSMDWETLLHMKKFIHLYDDVIKWNDSAGEEAFFNAKKRFWAQINGFSCDSSLPDPDLYIDKINWDSQNDQNPLFELEEEDDSAMVHSNGNSKVHDPVVIFGDSLVSGQEFYSTGWGDCEEGPEVPVNHYPSVDQGLVLWGKKMISVIIKMQMRGLVEHFRDTYRAIMVRMVGVMQIITSIIRDLITITMFMRIDITCRIIKILGSDEMTAEFDVRRS